MKGIVEAFKQRVEQVGWIDKQTVQAVKEKVGTTDQKHRVMLIANGVIIIRNNQDNKES